MDRNPRLVMLLLVVALSLVRLVRYMRTASSRRPSPAIPSAMGAIAPASPASPASPAAPVAATALEAATTSAPATMSPIEVPGSAAGRFVGGLAAALVLISGNVVIWTCLFGIPQLEEVPPLLRGLAGVLANFYLIHLARAAAARGKRLIDSGTSEDRNPIR
jgi:hypothetical protein